MQGLTGFGTLSFGDTVRLLGHGFELSSIRRGAPRLRMLRFGGGCAFGAGQLSASA